MFLNISIVIVMLLICLFGLLLKQSKKPTGVLGILMMRLWNAVYLPLVKWTMNRVELADHSIILDIGVGNGRSSAYLLNQNKALTVTGIDFSEAAISQAIKKYSGGAIHFKTMDVHKLAFSSETFDLVTAFQTHFHWDDLDQALHEIHRVLKVDGMIVFACETAKISYFLPELKKNVDFQAYMSSLGFSIVNHETTDQWTMFSFKKK
ncbi:hypothetical protein A5819_003274 [Enterococcus sp. 7E2_DIV0204]|uniref:class I SAM-dependent methyltransferase n=1 Tax=unclassified Enterococcus TaxID=2608891 RepID=UPI000A34F5B5|nr:MULTISPECIES: class I SAM-dependent methyltransferase [unclassified Enterococcus]OTN86440.1 hypothetical protein A5819_003274 [Enterococcus sp. 7E2_DIV0204]OTP48367.1 hypothetical protein A5884_003030 [Enterococcus sp. 7D2_DIV0200]